MEQDKVLKSYQISRHLKKCIAFSLLSALLTLALSDYGFGFDFVFVVPYVLAMPFRIDEMGLGNLVFYFLVFLEFIPFYHLVFKAYP